MEEPVWAESKGWRPLARCNHPATAGKVFHSTSSQSQGVARHSSLYDLFWLRASQLRHAWSAFFFLEPEFTPTLDLPLDLTYVQFVRNESRNNSTQSDAVNANNGATYVKQTTVVNSSLPNTTNLIINARSAGDLLVKHSNTWSVSLVNTHSKVNSPVNQTSLYANNLPPPHLRHWTPHLPQRPEDTT